MKEFNLWNLIECFGSKEEQSFLINCSDSIYEAIDDKVISLCDEIKEYIQEGKGQ
jgi:hypothetical protein